MKKLLVLCCVLLGVVSNSWSKNYDRKPPENKDFFIGTHYYGLAEYSWPINYWSMVIE